MPRAKASAEEAAANLDRRAAELRNAALKAKIVLCMKNRPSMIPQLWDKITSMGLDAESIKVPETVSKSFQAQAIERRKQVKQESELDGMSGENSSPEKKPIILDPVPTRYWHLKDLSVNLWRDKILPEIEQSSLSSPNLRSMKSGDASSKVGMARLGEFATGQGPNFSLSGKMRCFNELLEYLKSCSEKRGRRAMALKLPPNWPVDGLFEIVSYAEAEKTVLVRQKWSGEEATIPTSKIPQFDSLDDLWVDSNFSEGEACIESKKSGPQSKPYKLANDFCEHEYMNEKQIAALARAPSRSTFNKSSTQDYSKKELEGAGTESDKTGMQSGGKRNLSPEMFHTPTKKVKPEPVDDEPTDSMGSLAPAVSSYSEAFVQAPPPP